MPEEDELKPCPICGDTPRYYYNDDNVASIGCQRCSFETRDHRTEKSAAREWNSLPRKLQWTKEEPKDTGFYWSMKAPNAIAVVFVEIEEGQQPFFVVPGYDGPVFDLSGLLWAGPIPEPEE